MLKRGFEPAKRWIMACLLVLSVWVASASPAQAGKVMKALTFDATSGTVEAVALYETSYAAQKTVMKSLKTSSKLMKKAPGFKGASMFQRQDGKQVITFSQWQDLASYQAYTPAPIAESSTSTSIPVPPAPTQTLLFEVVTAQTSIQQAVPALRGKEAVVQFAQFVPKDTNDLPQVLTRLEAMLPAILEKQPVPQSIILLKGVDHDTIALLTNWNCSAMFEDVGKPEAIELSDEVVALVDHEQELYNVVNIIPAELKKAEDS